MGIRQNLQLLESADIPQARPNHFRYVINQGYDAGRLSGDGPPSNDRIDPGTEKIMNE
jgi:hypothetical protein